MPHIHSTIKDNIQSWQLTTCLNNTPQNKFKIGYLTKRGGKEERHANPKFAQPLARIIYFNELQKETFSWKAKCIMIATGLFQDRHSSLSDPQLTYGTQDRQSTCNLTVRRVRANIIAAEKQ